MKKCFEKVLLGVFMLLAFGCASSKVETSEKVNAAEENIEKVSEPSIFIFEFDGSLYVGVEGLPKTFAFKTDTNQLSNAFVRNSAIIILNNTDTYQFNFTAISSVDGITNKDSKHEMLEKYYNWEKDFQENSGVAIFQEDKKCSTEYKESEYLGWTYILNKEKIEPNNFVTTRGWTFLYGDYFVTIMESIAENQDKNVKNAEYDELYKKFFVFDSEIIDGEAVNRVVNDSYVPMDFSVNGGKTLDSYWEKYFTSHNTKYLDLILNYIESDDMLLQSLSANYEALISDAETKSIIFDLGIEDNGSGFSFPMDLDCVACNILNGDDVELKDSVKHLYSFFPTELLIRGAIKSSAMWSLFSNAYQYSEVKEYLFAKKSNLSEKTQALYELFF